MPTILRSGPYRLYFFSHEPNEPPHVHVDRDEQSCKFWLEPVALGRNLGFSAKELREIERLIVNRQPSYWRLGMNTFQDKSGERVKDVAFTEDSLSADLMDGRTITVPLAWYPRLLHATVEQRNNWKICDGGFGIHWPDIDEDLSTEGLLRGAPAPRSNLARVGT